MKKHIPMANNIELVRKVAEGFAIFTKYHTHQYIQAEQGSIYAGPDPELVSKEDLVRLKELGWEPFDYYQCFEIEDISNPWEPEPELPKKSRLFTIIDD